MSTNALKQNNDPNETYPKSSRSPKWMNLLKPIWSKYSRSSGPTRQHTGSSIILSSNPMALLDRLDLLLASHQAGNTGVRNEIVSICDELRRQEVVNDSKCKYLMNLI
jgi:hypothetical protein